MPNTPRTEDQLLAAVQARCAELGLSYFHVPNSIGMAPGWPDCVIIGSRILYRELKNGTHKVTPAQRMIGARLRRAGADWDIWRPIDWRSGRIARELEMIM